MMKEIVVLNGMASSRSAFWHNGSTAAHDFAAERHGCCGAAKHSSLWLCSSQRVLSRKTWIHIQRRHPHHRQRGHRYTVGWHTSLALTTAGFPVISYHDQTNGDLKLAVCADATCSSGTTIRTIDSAGNVGWYTSLALTTAGFPVISYYVATSQDLKLAVCADATCSSGTALRTVDSMGSVGEYTSLALTAAGFPVISYYDQTNGDLKLAVCADATCSSGTTILTIDSTGRVGQFTSLALATAGFPVVSYYDITNSGLKLAVCADTTCASGTTIRAIDSTANVGLGTALALTTAGFPVISYYDGANEDLKLGRWPCAPTPPAYLAPPSAPSRARAL